MNKIMNEYELYHANRKHKYIKKIGDRYFYTQQEIQAYYDGKKTVDSEYERELAVNSKKNSISDRDRQVATRTVSNAVDSAKNAAGDTKKAVSGSINRSKTKNKLNDVKEAVAEATGRRDVYYEAKKVTENGRAYYDDDNSVLRTGKKDKNGRKDPEDGSVYTKRGTMQYDNEYTRERNKKTRARGKKKLKRMATSPIRSLKKQTSKGRRAVSNWYKNERTPKVQVIDRVDSRTGKHF